MRIKSWLFISGLILGCWSCSNPTAGDEASKSASPVTELTVDTVHLAPLDWVVLVIYLLAVLGIGFYYSRQNTSEKDFFLGGGKMNPIDQLLNYLKTLL